MKKCVLIYSGGLDSTTILAKAKSESYEVYALSFNYGQRHIYELECAKKIAKSYGVNHKIFDINLDFLTVSSLTNKDIEVPKYQNISEVPTNITSTYVPARNMIFLSIALSYAENVGALDIFYGANKQDVHNYPDCSIEFLQSFEKMANIGTKMGIDGLKFKILAPLINFHKDEIIKLGTSLGVDYSKTISCYSPSPEGYACGECLSCNVRLENFKKLGIKDPAKYLER